MDQKWNTRPVSNLALLQFCLKITQNRIRENKRGQRKHENLNFCDIRTALLRCAHRFARCCYFFLYHWPCAESSDVLKPLFFVQVLFMSALLSFLFERLQQT